MSSPIKISSPFIRQFIHADIAVSTSVSTLLPKAVVPQRRVSVIIQNKSATATLTVIFNENSSSGILIPPLGSITLDNYNGIINGIASEEGALVHIAYAVI